MNDSGHPRRAARDRILDATMELLGEMPYARITVSDLIRRADVARVTFYRSFTDKDDAARQALSRFWMDTVAQPNPQAGSYEDILHTWQEMARQKNILTNFCSAGLSEILLDLLAKTNLCPEQEPGSSSDYYYCAYVGALYNMVRKWISRGCAEKPEVMAGYFYGFWNGSVLQDAQE